MKLLERLALIQKELKAPKSQFNQFGKYKYRNCEDIFEAVKPLLAEDCVLTLSDEVVFIGNRFYIKATAKIFNGAEDLAVSAFAREEESKKGMDGAQVSGAASSYARKYALNGLFLIDDTKDADTTNQHGKDEPVASSQVKKPVPDDVPIEPGKSAEEIAFLAMIPELQEEFLIAMAGDYPIKKPIVEFTASERLKFYKLLKSKEVK
jgi:hypothetical protein